MRRVARRVGIAWYHCEFTTSIQGVPTRVIGWHVSLVHCHMIARPPLTTLAFFTTLLHPSFARLILRPLLVICIGADGDCHSAHLSYLSNITLTTIVVLAATASAFALRASKGGGIAIGWRSAQAESRYYGV